MESALQTAEPALNHLMESLHDAYSDFPDVLVVGIADGGIALAEYAARTLECSEEFGVINPLFHRDDLWLKPVPKHFHPTSLPFEIEGRHVLILDDVFASGRTLRAALNELFDHGRPSQVRYGVLFDAGQRAMPYKPDYVGETLPLDIDKQIKVTFDLEPESVCHYEITTK